MRVLAVHYYAPPIQAVPAIRFHAILSRWSQQHPTWLLTSQLVDQLPTDPELTLPRVAVLKVPTKDWRSRQYSTRPYLPTTAKTSWWYRYFAKLYHAFPFVLLTGDGGRAYMKQAVAKASDLIEKEGITHLFSSYRPWADHLICYRLKQKYPQLIWIADFRDRAADPVRGDVWWPWLQAKFQGWLLKRANLVTAVSEGQAKHFRAYHHQVVVLRNGLKVLPNNFLSAPASTHFTITYTGSLYPGLQTAELLFRVLRDLIDAEAINPAHLELHYAGKDSATWVTWLQGTGLSYLSQQHGMLSLEEAKQLQRNSQLNLLLSWSAADYGGIMTAKLASYLEAGRPIIALLNGPDDPELTAAVEDTGAGWVYATHTTTAEDRLRQFLLDAYRTWAFSGALPWRMNSQRLIPYTWEEQLGRLSTQLEDVS